MLRTEENNAFAHMQGSERGMHFFATSNAVTAMPVQIMFRLRTPISLYPNHYPRTMAHYTRNDSLRARKRHATLLCGHDDED